MEMNERIDAAIIALEEARPAPEEVPAIIRLAPDTDAYVLGNREGYVQLAIASLKAAQGADQSFSDVAWVGTEELDWGLKGLRYDATADKYLPRPKTRVSRIRDKFLLVVFAVIGIVVLAATSIGFIDIITKVKHSF